MKAIWVTDPSNNWPAWDDIRKAGCNRIYFPAMRLDEDENGAEVWLPNDRQIENGYRRDDVLANHFGYGVWRDPKHGGILDPVELAELAHGDITAATGSNVYVACSYMFDIEFTKDSAYMLACFKRFRQLRPSRRLAWTLEPIQGGNLSRELVDWMNRDVNFSICPQTFYGDMAPVTGGPARVKKDLTDRGVKASIIRPCFDAAQPRPAGWDGFLFHAERLVP